MAKMTLTEQQQKVVENRGGTLLVSAAAGSGKTKVLVDRVMSKIINEGKNINEFLIITFTNAAASELRGKIASAISEALASAPENRHIGRQQNLLHLAQISTVHAFCGSLIRQYGYLLEIPSDYAMIEDPERNQILDRLLDDLLEEKYKEQEASFSLLADMFGPGRNDTGLIDLTRSLFEKLLSQPYPERWLREQITYLDEETELEKTLWGRIVIDDARQVIQGLISRYEWAVSAMAGDEKLIPKYLPCYETQLSQLKCMLNCFDYPWDSIHDALSMEFPRVAVQKYPDPDFLDAIKDVKSDCKKQLEKLQMKFARHSSELIREQNAMAPALEALKELVLELYKRFSAEKRRKNLLDFSDQEHLAIKLLVDGKGSPSAVAKEVSDGFTEIMVDEYQDSNRVQELIFTSICKDGDINRFLVGDVKQSIYGFRQAEPGIFIEKQNSYLPASEAKEGEARRLVLSKNFRSRPEILNAVNHVFRNVMRTELGDIVYDADEHLYPGLSEYPETNDTHVELHVLNLNKAASDDEEDATKYQKEAAWVANRIVEMLNAGTVIRDGSQLRPAEPKDFAILFRSKDPMNVYRKALSQRGIPVATGGNSDLFETPEVSVLISLLRVIDNPHQDIPLLSVLCSPMFRFSNEELARIRKGSQKRRFYDALLESDSSECKTAVEKLNQLRLEARRLSADQLVWHLLHDTGLLTAYCAMEGGSEHRENLLSVYSLCEKAAAGGHIYLYELLRYLERCAESGYSAAGEGNDGVILTTIHKSKGLEYPIVFLSDISRKFNFRELSDPVIVDSDGGIGAKITDQTHRVRYPGLGYEALKCLKHKALLSEELRILYVAMTRPKDYLIMTYSANNVASELRRLAPGAGIPAAMWTAKDAKCLGDWVLLSSLSRLESGALIEKSGYYGWERIIDDYPWTVKIHEVDSIPVVIYEEEIGEKKISLPSPHDLLKFMRWEDPHRAATLTPSKLTATQLKGRNKDEEAAENTPSAKRAPQIRRPDFIQEKKGLSATEKGTATHLFLQYSDFSKCTCNDGIISELDRMVDEEFLTEEQAEAINPNMIEAMFASPLGKKLLEAKELVREFKFSILTDASEYYPDVRDEQILLQGVIDAAIVDEDGLTVIDFKTDRVNEFSVRERAEQYRPQLETYKAALQRIWKKPVKDLILYFLMPGIEIQL